MALLLKSDLSVGPVARQATGGPNTPPAVLTNATVQMLLKYTVQCHAMATLLQVFESGLHMHDIRAHTINVPARQVSTTSELPLCAHCARLTPPSISVHR